MSGERVLIVEDEASVARGLEYALASEGFEVSWADSGQKALGLIRTKDPHIILLDIRLPDISGFDVCRQLRSEGRQLPVLMLTALDEEVDKIVGLELGADDYVVKPYHLREVIARIRALLRRSYGDLSPNRSLTRHSFGEVKVDFERLQVFRNGEEVFLTPIEFRLLRQFVSKPNQTFTREALIETVYGYEGYICDNRTIDVHIHHLRAKLESDPGNPRWFITVHGFG